MKERKVVMYMKESSYQVVCGKYWGCD